MKALILSHKKVQKKADGSDLYITQFLLENGDTKQVFSPVDNHVYAAAAMIETDFSELFSTYKSVSLTFDQFGRVSKAE